MVDGGVDETVRARFSDPRRPPAGPIPGPKRAPRGLPQRHGAFSPRADLFPAENYLFIPWLATLMIKS